MSTKTKSQYICVSTELFDIDDLNGTEKWLLAIIASWKKQGCKAPNAFFSRILNVSDRQVRNLLDSLELKGYVSAVYSRYWDNNTMRYISTRLLVVTQDHQNLWPPDKVNVNSNSTTEQFY